MLEPGSRHLLLDALRPPAGFTLDLAVGTTFTLDLLSLMTTPVAFAMFDRQDEHGAMVDDPVALLQALREHASRISIFCQAGMIAVPPQFRSLLVYLEDSIYPVVPPKPGAIFHPKVWLIRYRAKDDDRVAFRLLCLSRNLTFDRSWDTVLRLDGVPGDPVSHPELSRFVTSLVEMATPLRPLDRARADAILELGEQAARVTWVLPDGFDTVRFWPLGHDDVPRWPLASVDWRRDRMLVISPFVTPDTLSLLTKRRKHSILLTRPETLDALGGHAVRHLGERLVLSPDAVPDDTTGDGGKTADAATPVHHGLSGLHAKTYVLDAGRKAHVWTGSANATWPGFNANVEFLVELTGRKDRCGVHATIGDLTDRLGLRKLVEPYTPAQDDPLELTEDEKQGRYLDTVQRTLGGLRYTATCHPEGELWRVDLRGETAKSINLSIMDGIEVTVRPVTLNTNFEVFPGIDASGLQATFSPSEEAITPFFVISLASGDHDASFLIVAELIDPPPGRKERVLTNLLRKPADLIRLLLLLLGNIDDALAYLEGKSHGREQGETTQALFMSEALLEPLVRAYARDPDRLRQIERLLDDLRKTANGAEVLPERWDEVWAPLAEAMAGRTRT